MVERVQPRIAARAERGSGGLDGWSTGMKEWVRCEGGEEWGSLGSGDWGHSELKAEATSEGVAWEREEDMEG
jgi:hypothetical protein